MTEDLWGVALVQLGVIVAADWRLTEMIGETLKATWLGARIPILKLWVSLLLAPGLSALAYQLGWFDALPEVAARGVPMSGGASLASAAFAGFIAALIASGGHAGVKVLGNGGPPPAAGGAA